MLRLIVFIGRFKITMKSFFGNDALFSRKLSRIILLIIFRSTERFALRFATTMPKRACPALLSLERMVKKSLLVLFALSKT